MKKVSVYTDLFTTLKFRTIAKWQLHTYLKWLQVIVDRTAEMSKTSQYVYDYVATYRA